MKNHSEPRATASGPSGPCAHMFEANTGPLTRVRGSATALAALMVLAPVAVAASWGPWVLFCVAARIEEGL